MNTFTIRTHLLLLVLALSVPLLAAVGYDVYVTTRQSVAYAKNVLRTEARVLATNTNTRVIKVRNTLELLAERPLVKRLDSEYCDGALKEVHALNPDYSNIISTDREGRTICSILPQPDGNPVNVGQTSWFKELLENQRFTVGQPHLGPLSGKWVLSFSVPILDEHQEMAGAIHLPLDLARYDPAIPTELLPMGSRYGILDRHGTTIWSNALPGSENETKPDPETLRRLLDTRDREIEVLGEDGVARFFSLVPIAEAGWIAYVGIPVSELVAEAKLDAINHGVFVLLIVSLLILLATILARWIARPIAALEQVAQAIHGGQLSTRAAVDGPRELKALANTINAMIDAQQSSEQRLATLLQESPDAITITTLGTDSNVVVEVNPAYCEISGRSPEELLGRDAAEIGAWSSATQALAAKELLAAGTPINDLQSTLRRKDGSLASTSLSARRILIAGTPHLMLIHRDISERMRSHRRLQESEDRWRFAIEGHGDALWDWNLADSVIYRSPRLLELIGIPDGASICTVEQSRESIYPNDFGSFIEKIKSLMRGTIEEDIGQFRFLRPDGTTIWAAYRCRVMQRDTEGQAKRIIGTIRDITRRKQREQEMDIQIGKLSHQARLLALGEMASAMAHEVNQPLTAIAGYASACARRLQDQPGVLDIVLRIEEQALRAGKIVWRMRDFAKLRNTQRQRIELTLMVHDVFQWLSWDRLVNETELSTDIPAGLPEVLVDRVQIEQVLLNLIWNGIQAMAEMPGKRVIKVGATLGAAKNQIIVSVADRGCGLPSQVALDVFAPFFTSKTDGLGLGLSISRSIIEQHGGLIWSAPREGGGSIFSFSIPCANEEVPQ